MFVRQGTHTTSRTILNHDKKACKIKGVEGKALHAYKNIPNITKPANLKAVEGKALHKPGVCEAKQA